MNNHEIERIADAINRLRPDWPVRQLRTLLADPRLADRPRRDVTVALAWVACEAATHNPYRVLEAGPWWQAAGVDGTTTPRTSDKIPTADRCTACGNGEDHRLHHSGDHPFYRREEAPDFDTAAIAADLRARLTEAAAPMEQPVPRPTLDELASRPAVKAVREGWAAAAREAEVAR